MKQIIELFQQHPGEFLAAYSAVLWFFKMIITSLISALPAPTKDSTPKYVFWFQALNNIVGNFKRAKSTAIEASPNWQDAVKLAIDDHLAARERLNLRP